MLASSNSAELRSQLHFPPGSKFLSTACPAFSTKSLSTTAVGCCPAELSPGTRSARSNSAFSSFSRLGSSAHSRGGKNPTGSKSLVSNGISSLEWNTGILFFRIAGGMSISKALWVICFLILNFPTTFAVMDPTGPN